MNLTGKAAIVTGAAQGIGRTIALTLAQRGADMVVADVNEQSLQEVVAEIEQLGRKAVAVKVNVVEAADCEAMVKACIDAYGKIDILVNNAGITRDTVLLRMKEEQWDQVIAVNLKGTFNCTKAAIRPMFKAKYGRIVNISSVTGAMGNAGQANYSASKAAVMGFTKAIAREYGHCGITVNAVAPGFYQNRHDRCDSRQGARSHDQPDSGQETRAPRGRGRAGLLSGKRSGGVYHRAGCAY